MNQLFYERTISFIILEINLLLILPRLKGKSHYLFFMVCTIYLEIVWELNNYLSKLSCVFSSGEIRANLS